LPYRAPNANAFAERWVRTVREECLDKLLIFNQRHLGQVLTTYSHHYNRWPPHQGIAQQTPVPSSISSDGTIRRKEVLAGIINEYHRSG
ncbi:MAG: transposase, partial [Chloroflexi bacterium]|nr:transposase [Chloroflexota bacterium]